MTETSTTVTTPDHSAGVLAHGLKAVARHMVERKLPAPISIRAERFSRHIEVQVLGEDVTAWVDAMTVDDTHEHHFVDAGIRNSLTHRYGRITLGVRVDVVSLERNTPAPAAVTL